MDAMKWMTEQLSDPAVLKKISQTVKAEPAQVKEVAELGLPTLLGAMGRNSDSEEGALSLFKALEQHQEDPVDDVAGFLDKIDLQDGSKILQHVLGGKSGRVEQTLSQKTGLANNQVSQIMAQLAPILLGVLGQQKKKQNLNPADPSQLLGGMLKGGSGGGMMDMVSNLLDADNDGDIKDDVGKLLKGFLR